MNSLYELLKNIDSFGVTINFYTERKRKYYTSFGGFLTLLSIILGIIVFIFVDGDDFLHKSPISTTSQSKINNTKISFLKEKIWIPWRIRDYNSRTLNFTNLLYPIVFYYRGIYNETRKALDLTYTVVNYKLCNETSMAKFKDSYSIDIDLEKIYCIEMDDLEIGGGWDTQYVFYIQFDLYACKNGIDYDDKNPDCSSYEKIIESAGEDNSYSFDLFYPVVHYQPNVKENPLFVKYANYFYHLSRFSNKIDRLYLQKYHLQDDDGWLKKNVKNTTYWGYISLSGDSYATGNKKDLANEGSSSRLYSFNIYVNSDVVYYDRSYKKIHLLIANGLPNVNLIYYIFKFFAKIFGLSFQHKKIAELLFENLQEKHKNISLPKDKNKNYINKNIKNINLQNSGYNLNNNINSNNNENTNKKNSIHSIDKIKYNIKLMRNNYFKNIKNEKIDSTQKKIMNTEITNNNINNKNDISSLPLYKTYLKKTFSLEDKDKINNNGCIRISNGRKYIQKQLFPFKYYLLSIFKDDIDYSKKSFFFKKKFALVYNFIGQIFDISSYLILHKKCEILNNILIIKKYKAKLENKTKININEKTFNNEMKECLDMNNLSIIGKFKNNNINQ